MNFEDIKGRAVITIEEGERIGSIHDAVYDLEARQLLSFIVASGGLIGGSKHIVDVGSIHVIGPDAVTVQRSQDLRSGDDVPEPLARLSDLRRRNVITEGGHEIGRVSDLQIDDTTHELIALETRSGSRLLPMVGNRTAIPVSEVVSFGGDVVTVRDTAVPALDPGGAAST